MMRNEVLHGYLIHHRKYREKSHIVHLFTQEYGRVDGILRQIPPPQYQPIRIQATGKSELKNFTKLEILNQPVFFHGDAFFAGFYLNEILLRLCTLEEAMPQTFEQYQLILLQLQQLALHEQAALFLRQILRQFEHVLLQELGYAIDFSVDANQTAVEALQHYQFQLNDGFLPVRQASRSTLSGALITSMQSYEDGQDFSLEQLQLLGKLYRQMISALLGDRPLKSRQLWIQSTQT
ncbi:MULTISPECIES: DNA repair protein RecO C-terminal domain-containing protein [Acinetobacter]|jgi:DNA repair protein RecO (recombination protein O)|uniref:DNA repair protein RecO n=1 Tax=Acinetobacter venetianus (strain ATCC 31012 / DSM 23050 / BCRC 14357 / CCUG 45561 / CIP 110063 / KCTC 2702 / LMG 19082 / RAG-1) TaxID=1191460 RepID=N8ZVP4_ACIVR|nr:MULTISPECIES: DNA repair protein RecO C-terminal domain-containing protein [Acinetobacter]ENV37844.1 DNA repair protein RecO [Acinetobacter venetianus RAG-1 = CIP 110063]MBC68113.1 DNA repair protein RecO [Acinetobacter sp.]MBT50269.1 DNA repair protein RecO [Acinetobacter sp.]HIQ35768.1 DNA repair protein RecO [Acinetobacter venetianus]HJP47425.1 DNA repair protein RecO C-terminal domain-containing protein [Acinetobacter venetianus]